MPIRNPFARRPGPAAVQDENQRPGSAAGTLTPDAAHPGFERVDTVGSKASSAFSIHSSRKSQDTGEYKMSGMLRLVSLHPVRTLGSYLGDPSGPRSRPLSHDPLSGKQATTTKPLLAGVSLMELDEVANMAVYDSRQRQRRLSSGMILPVFTAQRRLI